MHQFHRVLPTLAAASAVLTLSACSSTSTSASTEKVTVTVTSTDNACQLSRTSVAKGKVEFTVTNSGSKLTELYLLGEGDRVISEVEDISPGLSRTMTVELTQPGTYTAQCKPGMAGDGLRTPLTVT